MYESVFWHGRPFCVAILKIERKNTFHFSDLAAKFRDGWKPAILQIGVSPWRALNSSRDMILASRKVADKNYLCGVTYNLRKKMPNSTFLSQDRAVAFTWTKNSV